MTTKLSKAHTAALNRASQPAVVRAAGEVCGRFLPNNRWLGVRNRYGSEILERLAEDLAERQPEARQLSQYVAASSFHHCADGWSYFGRALSAHLSGDAEAARHLGYYAELRAAVGILATHGIGIFNRVHAVLEPGPTVRLFNGPGTHVMSWLTLPYWAKRQEATATLARIVAPHQVPLDIWAGALPGAGAFRPLAEGWLNTWGLDLKTLALDRDSRNESSYQPSRISGRRTIDALTAATFASDLWALLEPATPSDPFPVLDLQLLRRGLERLYEAAGRSVSDTPGSPWETAVDAAIDEAVGDPAPAGLRDFLLRRNPATAVDSEVFEHASAVLPVRDPGHHLGVLSRALLLLRVCSGCVSDLAVAAGVTGTTLRFWHEALAEDRGLWAVPPLPTPVTDLYADVEVGLQDVRRIVDASPPNPTYRQLRTDVAEALLALGGCERVVLWSTAA